MSAEIGLIYVGGGFLPDVPARDLRPEEIEQHGGKEELLASGLYEEPKPKSARKKAEE